MTLRKLLLSVTALALLLGAAGAGEIAPGLQAQLDQTDDQTPVKAIVFLSDRLDITSLDLDLHLQKTTLATRHQRVINELKDVARVSQGPLLAALDAERAAGGLVGYTPHWIVNGVVVLATKDVLYRIAERQDVDRIEPDIVPELMEPVAAYDAPDGDRGIGITPGVVNIGARRVWDELGIRGEGVIVGVLDTGVDGNHPALASRWRGLTAPPSECWLDVIGSNPNFPTDFNSHGTHVMGTITGLADDDTIGVAPGALWIGCNPIDQSAGSAFDSDVLVCLAFMADPDGDPGTTDDVPDVIQNSWGINENFSSNPPYTDCDSRWWDAIDAVEAAGCVVTWSAGNEGPGAHSLRSPADRATSLYNVFSVGSTQPNPPFTISSFSSRGPAGPNCGPAENLMKPEISAPGSDIYSSVPGGGYGYKSGTSMAGPHVAGVVALMRSANPNLDVITIKQVIMETALDLGDPGEDNTYGHGFIDAYECVLAVMDGLGYLEGTLVDADTGLPVPEAAVQVVGGYQSDVTDENGQFNLTLQQGQVDLTVTRFGYLEGNYSVTIVEDQTLVETFEIDPAPSYALSGRVIDPQGVVVVGATVEALDTPLSPVVSGAGGWYSLNLPQGLSYDIRAEKPLVGRMETSVEMQGPVELDLHLLPLDAQAQLYPEVPLYMVLVQGTQGTRQLSITNNGGDGLSWRLAAEEVGGVPREAVPVFDPLPLPKGAEDPREGQSPVADSGGPDQYGYIWVDSNEPGGPTFDWVDISGVGESVGNSDDESYGPFDIGFAFPYYGDTFTQLRICTNGFIFFDVGSTADPYTNGPMPNTAAPDLMVAPFWDDLNPSQGGNIYRYFDEANDRYIVQWDGVPHFFSDGSFTFQVILYASGVIVFQYDAISYGNECTVGIENHDATDGLQVVYNSTYLQNGMAIMLSAGSQVPWLDYTPLAGVVAPGETMDVDFTFDATGLALGDHEAVVTFTSNDPDHASVTIPALLTVSDSTTPVGELPLAFSFAGAVPNPFNPATTLRFTLPADGHAELRVFDVQGRLVRSLVDGERPAGANEARWDGRDSDGRQVASGTYFARLKAAGETSVKSLVLVK
jgi:subtilisin family serine protease